jgi:hypothetical protein
MEQMLKMPVSKKSAIAQVQQVVMNLLINASKAILEDVRPHPVQHGLPVL